MPPDIWDDWTRGWSEERDNEPDDEQPGFDESRTGPEYEMYKERARLLRPDPCGCGFYNSLKATYCQKCEVKIVG